MKKLTKEQVQKIEQYLIYKNITYIDLRFEVLDHIIIQIEDSLNTSKLDFDQAFNQVSMQWNVHFTQTTSLLFGVLYSAPKMIIKKAKKQYWKYFRAPFFLMMVFLLIGLIVKTNAPIYVEYTLKGLTLLFVGFSFLMYNKINKSNKKTVYSFIAKTQMPNFIVLPIVVLGIFENIYLIFGLFIYTISFFYSGKIFLKQHRALIKQFE